VASSQERHCREYVDVAENIKGRSARVYLFQRDTV
jgi:hypothetical protein